MQVNRFNRSDFYKKVVVDGIEELDLTSNAINDFKFSREMTLYTIVAEDIQRPDLIAIKAYGDKNKMNVWWIIGRVNNILDFWNDIKSGDTILIPHKNDLEDFLAFTSQK